MAVVLEAMPFSAAWRKRQNRVQAIQRLDGALLVDAEDSGVPRWFEVQADDVRTFVIDYWPNSQWKLPTLPIGLQMGFRWTVANYF